MIQQSKFEDALEYLKQINPVQKNKFNLHKSYCEYRLNDVNEALQSLKLADPDDFGVKELTAQTLYRLEKYADCYSQYVDLFKNSDDEYEDERFANLAAVVSAIYSEDPSFETNLLDTEDNTYEMIYNRACILVAKEQFGEAMAKLNEADGICRKFMEEDGASEEEINSELAIIKAQIAYCYQKQNKESIALKLYNQIHRQK